MSLSKNNKYILIGILILLILSFFVNKTYFISILFYTTFIQLILFIFKNKTIIKKKDKKQNLIILTSFSIVCVLTILLSSFSPYYNGKIETHRNGYEKLTDSLIDHHLYIDFDDSKLKELDNPYDPAEREEKGLVKGEDYLWDHAYYNGHFYLYFGIVPVILIFLPFRLITGFNIATYHVTQIFVILTILCFYKFTFKLMQNKNITIAKYLLCCITFSSISLWYILDAPSLYCTAISAGICTQIWCFYLLYKAVFIENEIKKQKTLIIFGSILGALTFGCRPTIGLANISLIPLVFQYVKRNCKSKNIIKNILIAFIPYIVIGCLLMLYNYVRFDNIFEFGQTYQITLADQSKYRNVMEKFDNNYLALLQTVISNFKLALFDFKGVNGTFPFIEFSGIIISFPVFLLLFLLFNKRNRRNMKQNGNLLFIYFLLLTFVTIIIYQTLWSPFFIERYKMDFNFIICLAIIFIISSSFEIIESRKFNNIIIVLVLISLVCSSLMYFIPYEHNITDCYNWINPIIDKILLFR